MKTLKLYQIDAFTKKTFEGNPAAICPLETWLDDALMQRIAEENNLSETAFFVETKGIFHIRWFTPTTEVDMCGHATLASAHVIYTYLSYKKEEIIFDSKSGILKVSKEGERYTMDFPIQKIQECEIPIACMVAFDVLPVACYKAMDYILVFENEEDITNAKPDMQKLKELDLRGIMITAQSKKYAFITRFFAPKYGIDEDPVTGSAFTQLLPYWSKVLEKKTFNTKQVSPRGGEVFCELKRDRVLISGYAVTYLEGTITLQ